MPGKKLHPITLFVVFTLISSLLYAPAAVWAGDRLKVVHRFNGSDGAYPSANLIIDSAGNLYGTTENGGTFGFGTVFRLAPDAKGEWSEKVLHSFNQNDGADPLDSLIFDAAGNLYGTTAFGGDAGYGTVFMLVHNVDDSWTEKLLHSFNGDDGGIPYGSVIFDSAGNLYGAAGQGGSSRCPDNPDGCGVVFKLKHRSDGGWTETVIHNFNGTDGEAPSNLTFDNVGNLYGATLIGGDFGCGVVFRLKSSVEGKWTENVLHSFEGSDGCVSFPAGLILDAVGNLYGTTQGGGVYGYGTVFQLSPTVKGKWSERVLHSFNHSDGADLLDSLILDAGGNLYSTTWAGGDTKQCPNQDGNSGCGVVFKLTRGANGRWTDTVLHKFSNTDGAYPWSGLVRDKAGHLYGTTENGGNLKGCYGYGCGVVFEVRP